MASNFFYTFDTQQENFSEQQLKVCAKMLANIHFLNGEAFGFSKDAFYDDALDNLRYTDGQAFKTVFLERLAKFAQECEDNDVYRYGLSDYQINLLREKPLEQIAEFEALLVIELKKHSVPSRSYGIEDGFQLRPLEGSLPDGSTCKALVGLDHAYSLLKCVSNVADKLNMNLSFIKDLRLTLHDTGEIFIDDKKVVSVASFNPFELEKPDYALCTLFEYHEKDGFLFMTELLDDETRPDPTTLEKMLNHFLEETKDKKATYLKKSDNEINQIKEKQKQPLRNFLGDIEKREPVDIETLRDEKAFLRPSIYEYSSYTYSGHTESKSPYRIQVIDMSHVKHEGRKIEDILHDEKFHHYNENGKSYFYSLNTARPVYEVFENCIWSEPECVHSLYEGQVVTSNCELDSSSPGMSFKNRETLSSRYFDPDLQEACIVKSEIIVDKTGTVLPGQEDGHIVGSDGRLIASTFRDMSRNAAQELKM